MAVDTAINFTIARQLKASGLPMVKDFFSKPASLVLVVVSPGLMKPRCKLNRRFKFVGYNRWQARQAAQLEEEVARFTGGEAVPVLSFGSMVYQEPRKWMERLARNWPADRKLIVQSGWAKFEKPANCDNILVIGAACHDWLFRLASVVIHHGGAGTTASALHAGRPHVVVPHIGDQNFFAHEVKRLGCGMRLGKERWPERLAGAVEKVEDSRRMAVKAEAARQTLLGENGPEWSVDALEKYVRCEGGESLSSDGCF